MQEVHIRMQEGTSLVWRKSKIIMQEDTLFICRKAGEGSDGVKTLNGKRAFILNI